MQQGMGTDVKDQARVRSAMREVYRRLAVRGVVLRQHKGVSAFGVDQLKPSMRRSLDRHIMAAVNLIKLNKEQAVSETLRRFQGWATSIPAGGSDVVDKRKVKTDIRKSARNVTYAERRVTIDQSQKFAASLNAVIAEGNEAIAGTWHSRWRTPGYDYREDHKERDEQVYAIRDNWAIRKGLMKVGPAGYTDAITQPAEEVFCQCRYVYIYNLSDLPDFMLTEKGRALVAQGKAMLRG
jgi:hypothetical protein